MHARVVALGCIRNALRLRRRLDHSSSNATTSVLALIIDAEEADLTGQLFSIVLHEFAGAGCFLNQGGILLCGTVHLSQRQVYLINTTGLFLTGCGNLRDDVGDTFDAGDNFIQ